MLQLLTRILMLYSVSQFTGSPVYSAAGNELPSNHECCPTSSSTSRGKALSKNEFPSLALLHYKDSSGRSRFPFTAVLISKRYLITGAHCVTGKGLRKLGDLINIRLGETDMSDAICTNGKCNGGVQEYEIDQILVPEGYSETEKTHDIALIRLESPVPVFTDNIRPACLPWIHSSPESYSQFDDPFTVVGFGRTAEEKQSRIGKKSLLPRYDRTECAKRFKMYATTVTEKHICAGGGQQTDSCNGNSRGPLLTVNKCSYLDGYISFGIDCALGNWPAVYTNVTEYRDWIMENIKP